MSTETISTVVTELEEAWTKEDVKACYDLLADIPDGVKFKLGNMLFMLAQPLEKEKELMRQSVEDKDELGIIISATGNTLIKGLGRTIDLDEVAGALYGRAIPEEPAVFSHTHWDKSVHPLPGFAEVGFGDIPLFNFFLAGFPLLECRVVFNSGEGIRSIIYKGKVAE